MDFNDQVIAITGGASGIGLETASQLAAQGASVALIDLNQENLDRAAEVLPGTVITLRADVTEADDVDRAVLAIVTQFGKLDGLVACAGIRMRKYTRVVELADEDWDSVLRVNLRGIFITCRAAARQMQAAASGSIVTLSSLSGHAPRIGQSAYSASKAGVTQLSKVLALELAEQGVRVNTICPGIVNTAMLENSRQTEGDEIVNRKLYGYLPDFRAGIPLRRYAEPADIANAALFLLSPHSRHITGQCLFVDGGESLV